MLLQDTRHDTFLVRDFLYTLSLQRTKGRLSPANIVIRSPLYRQPPSLAHSARLAINKTLTAQSCYSYTQLHLPAKLVDYLRSYTLTI